MSKVGILHSGTDGKHNPHIDALGIKPGDIVGGKPLYANDNPGLLDQHAWDLVNAHPNVLIAAGGSACADAMQKATKNAEPDPSKRIPVVFTSRSDNSGLEPNVTGVSAETSTKDLKRFEFLSTYFLSSKKGAYVAILYNSSRSNTAVSNAATALGLHPVPQQATDLAGIGNAFQSFVAAPQIDALIVLADPLFNDHRKEVVEGADSLNRPAIYQWREFLENNGPVNGLISYGTNLTVAYALAGSYVRRILANPGAAVPQPRTLSGFELIVNLKTAASQNINIPEELLAQAHEVILK